MNIGIKTLIYLLIVSIYAVCITYLDKYRAVVGKGRRIPEKRLFLTAIFGGSVAMYITMQIIRHKTKHKRFMIGLPLIMLIQFIVLISSQIYV